MSEHHKPTLREANLARQAEWDPNDSITLAYRGNELAGEIGEACNVIKKLERERLGIRGSRATTAQLAEELADAVICLDLIAMQAGIDLDEAVRNKFNATSEKYGLATRLTRTRADVLSMLPGDIYWLIGKGRTRPDEPLYGVQLLEPQNGQIRSEAEHEDLTIAIAIAVQALR